MNTRLDGMPADQRVAIDIGGTFTDAVAVGQDGQLRTAKVLSKPEAPDSAVLATLERLEVDAGSLAELVHGTTAGLNALLERQGSKFALVMTRGFRDVYEIGRANRPAMYDIHYRRPPMLIRRRDIFEVSERVAADGEVVTPLDEDELRLLAVELAKRYEAIAICLLHAYRWPAHEQRAAEIVTEAASWLSVVTSHEVAAEWREYERVSTTCVSTYITPKLRQYLGRLEGRLRDDRMTCELRVMQSNGGASSAREATRNAVRTLFSGPVGGTVAGAVVGRHLGHNHLICVDMGGTSFDMSLVVDRSVAVESQFEILGHPVLAPAVAIHSLGAGGGSIIHLESEGLRVGPRSAGGDPGPACYGRGGEFPTVTDANLLLGRIPQDAKLGGWLSLDPGAAEKALRAVADELKMDAVSLALGAIEIIDNTMADGIREITVARGVDPREFAMVAFGGAGPLHAAALADELDIRQVVVPHRPGVLSAWGMLQADTRHDLVHAFFSRLEEADAVAISTHLDELQSRGKALLDAEGSLPASMTFSASADLRYVGQEYTITVPLDLPFGASEREALRALFDAAYLRRYGHSNPDEAVEIVNLRLAAVAVSAKVDIVPLPPLGTPVPLGTIFTIFPGGGVASPVYERLSLGGGSVVEGPCVLLEQACTTLIPPEWVGKVSEHGHILMERKS